MVRPSAEGVVTPLTNNQPRMAALTTQMTRAIRQRFFENDGEDGKWRLLCFESSVDHDIEVIRLPLGASGFSDIPKIQKNFFRKIPLDPPLSKGEIISVEWCRIDDLNSSCEPGSC
jgi:hypothetical protein